MKKITTIALLLFLFCSSTYAQWKKTIGPSGAGLTNIVRNGNKLFAVENSAIMYVSTDFAKSWNPIPKQAVGFQPYTCVEVLPNGRMIVGGTSEGIQYSDDDGNTWSYSALTKKQIVKMAVNKNMIYALTDQKGIYKMDIGLQSAYLVTDKKTGLDSTTEATCIHWQGDTIVLQTQAPRVNLVFSFDNGNNWDTLPYKIKGGVGFINSIGSRWYLYILDSLVYSNNFFASLTKCKLPPKFFKTNNNFYLGLNAYGNDLYLYGYDGIHKSTDNGITWNSISVPLCNKNVLSFLQTSNTLYAATWGGLYKSANGGQDWYSCDSNIDHTTIVDILETPTTLLASSQYSGIYFSTDNGMSWTQSRGIYNGSDYIRFSKEGNELFAANDRKIVYRSYDDGKTWEVYTMQANTNPTGRKLNFVYTKGILYLEGAGLNIYTMDTVSKTWSNFTWLQGTNNYGMLKNGNNIYIAMDGGLYKTNDDGKNWMLLHDKIDNKSNSAFAVRNNRILFMGTGTDTNYYSIDTGKTWKLSLGSHVSNAYINDGDTIYANGPDTLSGGKKAALYKSVDGVNWTYEQPSFLLNNIAINIIHYYKENIFACIDYSVYYRKAAIKNLAIQNIETEQVYIYPNPTSDALTYHLQNNAQIKKIEIRTIEGKLVSELGATNLNTIDISYLQSGLYLFSFIDLQGNIYNAKIVKK